MSKPNTPNNSVPAVPNNTPVEEWKYALLQETNGQECESWYYFIRYQGNEEALAHLEKQLESIDWYTLDDLSTFVIETQYLVSERTAKEMTKVDLNPTSFHRKFDGTLRKIDLGLRDSYGTEKKMVKVFDKLSFGQIENYIDNEDIDEEDIVSNSESESESDHESVPSDSESEEEKERPKKTGKLPGALSRRNKHDIPRYAKAKKRGGRRK